MKILSFRYCEIGSNWNLPEINLEMLTLLVGASGVGKTKILNAIENLKNLALGKESNRRIPAINWSIKFIENESTYIWSGETNIKKELEILYGNDEEKSNTSSIEFTYEKLVKVNHPDTLTIFERSISDINFLRDKIVPKVTTSKSYINIFSEEEHIAPIIKGFNSIYSFHFENERRVVLPSNIKRESEALSGLDEEKSAIALAALRESNMPILGKMYFAYRYFEEIFNKIKEDFIDIFEYIIDLRFHKDRDNKDNSEPWILQIKEENSDWIPSSEISSGMFKSLTFVGMNYLIPKNSVILIDEFENSLGINCIDLLPTNLNPDAQYLLTSHHPYIINKISMNQWKIVSRHSDQIVVKNASDYKIGHSKHEAFKQLINLTAYTEGREEA
ncbi:hypothetical protein A8709_25850 [Paenibacillus pectinilyticus]|uniref:ATPase AAA-type core domain-containing protein n=1 Tax=Paenibacillus pectinilyticus TaxID=512399 RepID=A0A1C1A137_9BACL|nr:AAA family ATPase [Paenibacillus pectinilyticus]OCT14256.1 hypothetical protein A8709_25850 [Paenibacillus pectinilyticus]